MSKSATRRRTPHGPSKRSAPKPPSALPPRKPPILLWAALGAIVVATVVGTILLWPRAPGAEVTAGTSWPRVLTRVDSLYNDITVYEQQNGLMTLAFGAKRLNYVESVVNPNDELDLPVTYTQSMTAGLAFASTLESAAIIGLGGGRTAWYHHKSVPKLDFTAAELDPEVARIAGRYFNVHPEQNFDIQVQDGRVWLSKSDKTFDIVLIDAYRGPFVPFHLLTTEFYRLVAEHLKPGGVAVQNVEPSTMLFDSAVATISAAFDHLVFLRGAGNIVIVAYNGPEKDEASVQRLAAERTQQYGLRYDLTEILTRRFTPEWDKEKPPLTDDFAPVEYLKAIDRHNEKQT